VIEALWHGVTERTRLILRQPRHFAHRADLPGGGGVPAGAGDGILTMVDGARARQIELRWMRWR